MSSTLCPLINYEKSFSESAPNCSYDKIQSLEGLLLKLMPPFAQLRDRHPLGYLHHCFPDFLHRAPDGAARLIRTRAFLVKPLAHTTHRRQRTFDVPHHRRQRDFFGRLRQPVSPRHPAPALHDSSRLEIIQNLLEETLRNVLVLRDRLNSNDGLSVLQTQYE